MADPRLVQEVHWRGVHCPDRPWSPVCQEDLQVSSVILSEAPQLTCSYYKQHGYKTIVMGASFRNVGEITELAGCDYLTIAPKLLEELKNSSEPVPKKLDASKVDGEKMEKVSYLDDESKFRWAMFEDTMAFDKLHEGIRGFAKDGKLSSGSGESGADTT
jgi:transaldolase